MEIKISPTACSKIFRFRKLVERTFIVFIISIGYLSYVFHHFKSFKYKEVSANSAAELPLCTKHILDKRFYEYSFDSLNVAMTPKQNPPCKLMQYKEPETVQCFDTLLYNMTMKKPERQLDDKDKLLITFVGDSKVRQLYYERLKVFPFLEEGIQETSLAKHKDRISNISIFNNSVTFQMLWSPYLNTEVLMNTISEWANPDSTQVIPHFLLLGISSWYMRVSINQTHLDYERHLKDIYPLLERLSIRMKEKSGGKIVWMMQYPRYDESLVMNSRFLAQVRVNSEKLNHYNSIARRIFRNDSIVQVWDAWVPIMEDYFRACMIHQRSAPFYMRTWKDCTDENHAGFVASSQGFQFLLNYLCNSVISTTFP